MNSSGPARFTFDTATGALLTTAGGGAGSDVNIAAVGGNPVAMDNALPVELSDGTNPFGTDVNPLFAKSPGAETSSACAATAVGGTAAAIVSANPARLEVTIVNTGTTVVYLGLGKAPTTTAYHIALSPCSVADDGLGGTYTTNLWKGEIQAICAVGGTVAVTELTP